MELCTYKIVVTGTVQGVGFRPFIYALAQRYLLTGTVSNNSNGVEIHLNTDSLTFKQFLTAVEYEYPPLSSIDHIAYEEMEYQTFNDFQIIETQHKGDVTVNIPPDVSICKVNVKENFLILLTVVTVILLLPVHIVGYVTPLFMIFRMTESVLP